MLVVVVTLWIIIPLKIDAKLFENTLPKRLNISGAINNFREYKINISIEPKKIFIRCFYLMKLVSKQFYEKKKIF